MADVKTVDQLEAFFEEACGCSKAMSTAIGAAFDREVSVKRNDFLVAPGSVDRNLYFVLEGALGIFHFSEEKEICVGFAYQSTLVSSLPSFLRGIPSGYGIKALRKCRLLAVSREAWDGLRREIPALEVCWVHFLEEALLGRIEREAELLSYDPSRRLERLLERSPHLFQAIPLKHIAAYLDMAPETLSRSLRNLDPRQDSGKGNP